MRGRYLSFTAMYSAEGKLVRLGANGEMLKDRIEGELDERSEKEKEQ